MSKRLDQAVLPKRSVFAKACRDGLSSIYPFKSRMFADPYGWKFDSGWPPSYGAFGRMRSLLAVHDALLLQPQTVLEVAAGGGGLSATLAQSGCQVTANDLLEDHLAKAFEEYVSGASIQIIGGNMFDLSPSDLGKFDLVIACEVIEHVAHPRELLSHLKQFLKPDSHILLTTPNGLYFRNKLPTYSEIKNFEELEPLQFKPDADGHLFLFTPNEISDLVASVGLHVERLNVWGTPMLSGHAGFRHLAGLLGFRVAYGTELWTQRLPSVIRERVCTALSVILRLG